MRRGGARRHLAGLPSGPEPSPRVRASDLYWCGRRDSERGGTCDGVREQGGQQAHHEPGECRQAGTRRLSAIGKGSISMDMRLEVVVLPVLDVDRARDFYRGLGWRLDADFATSPEFRVVQLT